MYHAMVLNQPVAHDRQLAAIATPAAKEAADPPPSVGCTTTCDAVMVVLLVMIARRFGKGKTA